MPQKPKYSKDEIVDVAFKYVKENSLDKLTARELGKKLNCSAKPIFGYFSSMEEVKNEVIKKAKKLYGEYILKGMENETKPFKGVGKGYIQFAIDEPVLFRMLFMRPLNNQPTFKNLLLTLDDNYETIINSIKSSFFIEDEKRALEIYRGMWILVHGIGTLIATNVYSFSKEEIDRILTNGLFGYINYEELIKKAKSKG